MPTYIPFDDDLDIFEEPDGLLAVSGMCVNNALKKLYSCVYPIALHPSKLLVEKQKKNKR